MANFNSFRIKHNSVVLSFSSWGFSKDVELYFDENKERLEKLLNIVKQEVMNNCSQKIKFHYDGHDIVADRSLCVKCIFDIEKVL